MKTIMIKGIILLLLIAGIISCKKNNEWIDQDNQAPPTAARFISRDTVGTYYVQNITDDSYKIPIGITTVSDKPRTVTLTITSPTGAVQGTQYSAPTTITIPAGKAVDTLVVKGLFANFPTGRIDTLKISISSASVNANAYYSNFRLILKKYCTVDLAALSGIFANTNEYSGAGVFSYGPYTTQVKNLVSTGNNTATCKIANIYDDGWVDVTANLDWSNPAAFKVTVPLQTTGKTYSGVLTYVRSSTVSTAINTFSSCDNSISLAIDLTNSTGTTVSTSNYRVVLKK